MRGTAAANGTAGANQGCSDYGFIHNLADRARAAAALRAAAETAIDFTAGARGGRINSAAHFVVAQDVAGTDDHRKPGFNGFITDWHFRYRLLCAKSKQIRSLKTF
jgi:hypothetical protein